MSKTSTFNIARVESYLDLYLVRRDWKLQHYPLADSNRLLLKGRKSLGEVPVEITIEIRVFDNYAYLTDFQLTPRVVILTPAYFLDQHEKGLADKGVAFITTSMWQINSGLSLKQLFEKYDEMAKDLGCVQLFQIGNDKL